MQSVLNFMGLTFLGGGILFGIALFRARVLARWASALLALASLFTASLAVLPDAFFRFLAFPNSIALIGLGVSLWLSTRTETSQLPTGAANPPLTAASVR